MKCASVCILALAAALAAGARAQGEVEFRNPAVFAPNSAANSRHMSPQQREEWRFLKDAAASARFESEASRLALNRSGNLAIRSYATTLIKHHTATGNELLHMLHMRGMAPPMLANDQRKSLNRLGKLRGAKFERAFIEEVGLKRQQGDVQAFERAGANTPDPQLKAWIDKTLITLRDHVNLAERLSGGAQAMGAGRAKPGSARHASRQPSGSSNP